jgi:glycosyltransferase involved in cell wall biosynthesis
LEKLKIAVNTRLLIENKLDGIGWFSFETLKRITLQHPDVKFYFLFDRPFSEDFIFSKNIEPVILKPQARHPILYYIWFEYSVQRFLRKKKVDLFLSPDGYLSLSAKLKTLTVIHDINFFHRPFDLPFAYRHYYNYFFPKFARKAMRIATVSEHSKNDIVQSYGISPDKIDVIYNGANILFKPLADEEKLVIKEQYAEGCEYFLFVGTLHPRKNVHSLIRAFSQFKESNNTKHKLLIVGSRMFLTREIQKALDESKYANDVIYTGRLLPEELRNVMASAWALTFVPFYEGFGIPMVEAMYCDVPVIASDVTSLPEIAGDAALYADPFSIDSIAEALKIITHDIELRESLIARGREQRKKYTWNKTADALWESIEKCLS